MSPATRAFALLFPYVLAALATRAVVTASGAVEPPAAASASAGSMQAAYAACRDRVQPSPSPAAQGQRARQHHQDPAGRSQRPAWVQQADGDLERCLRGGPGGALATRTPSRYAKRL